MEQYWHNALSASSDSPEMLCISTSKLFKIFSLKNLPKA